ncbi:MAG: endonuclease/exonuclease/phosphatase family protein [Muribaculaceae bacterium]|nr:endonuclease/exonuclease/phosphatase family protein [Muribaculaceae bacterium]
MKKFLAIITLLCTAAGAWAVVPEVVAHRGYHRAPGSAENSIRALVKADSIGAEKCEFDVWISADDVLYVNHNADVDGVVIETADSERLDRCHLRNGETPPRLDAFLDTARTLGIDLVLEVKPHKDNKREDVAVPMIIKMIADKGLTDRTSYITFSRHAFDILVRESGRPVLYLNAVTPKVLKEIGGAGADYHINHFRRHPEWIDELHAQGMPVNIWTVDSEADIQWCIDHGADLITTNEPELAQKLIAKAYAPREIKVMSYNIRFGELASMERIAKEIKEQNPDFVALQEVDVNSFRNIAPHNNGRNFINELAMHTGMFGYFGRTVNFSVKDGYYGIAILSRHPTVKVESLDLPNYKNVEPRVMLKGEFLLDGHKPFVFASTHLSVEDASQREEQARYIVKLLGADSIPAVLAGDFNATPDMPAVKILEEEGAMLCGDAPTYPAKAPDKRLDYIFGFPKAAFRLEKTAEGPISPYAASDHLPIVSTILVDFSK